jgi:hypothetical protein
MEITYTNTYADQVAHAHAALGGRRSSLAFYHYFWVLYWAAMAGFGVYVSLFVGQIFFACIFVAMFALYAFRALPYSRVWKWSAQQAMPGSATTQICLRLDERGLQETIDGAVESFAPWRAIRSFILSQDHLFIELTGNLWANIPRSTVVGGEAAFREAIETLRAHGVSERTV